MDGRTQPGRKRNEVGTTRDQREKPDGQADIDPTTPREIHVMLTPRPLMQRITRSVTSYDVNIGNKARGRPLSHAKESE